jgi:hypothetical protein
LRACAAVHMARAAAAGGGDAACNAGSCSTETPSADANHHAHATNPPPRARAACLTAHHRRPGRQAPGSRGRRQGAPQQGAHAPDVCKGSRCVCSARARARARACRWRVRRVWVGRGPVCAVCASRGSDALGKWHLCALLLNLPPPLLLLLLPLLPQPLLAHSLASQRKRPAPAPGLTTRARTTCWQTSWARLTSLVAAAQQQQPRPPSQPSGRRQQQQQGHGRRRA